MRNGEKIIGSIAVVVIIRVKAGNEGSELEHELSRTRAVAIVLVTGRRIDKVCGLAMVRPAPEFCIGLCPYGPCE